MKICRIKTTPLAFRFKEPYHWAGRVDYGMAVVLIEVETDEGIVGVGESTTGFPAEGTVARLLGVAPQLIGAPVTMAGGLVLGNAEILRLRRPTWKAKGRKRLGMRLRDKTIGLIESHRPEALPAAVETEIDAILKQA
jgi:L-alanine-DL-glutamate epimerase-like enolase superfamily enzyme